MAKNQTFPSVASRPAVAGVPFPKVRQLYFRRHREGTLVSRYVLEANEEAGTIKYVNRPGGPIRTADFQTWRKWARKSQLEARTQ